MLLGIVAVFTFRLTRPPATASKSMSPTLPGVAIETVLVSPSDMRPVVSMSVDVYGEGGTKKSALLTALPFGVATEILPEVPRDGGLVAMLVAVAEPTKAYAVLKV